MLPEAFLDRMQQLLGEEYGAFLGTFEQERYQALRLNPLKLRMDGRSAVEVFGDAAEVSGRERECIRKSEGSVSREKGAEISAADTEFAHLTRVSWAKDGYYYRTGEQPGKHPYHEAGLYYIQEPSAMAPVELLGVQPGERVLDLCAAPGGKSTQIAAKLRGSGILICNEIHPARAKILSENIERMGIGNACVTNETPERLVGLFPEYFDRILVDAPCSGEGMFRKNEAACEEWSPENVMLCSDRQAGILDCAARMLRPGGRLVYSTCTFAPEENEGSVAGFLRRQKEFDILAIAPLERERLGLSGSEGRPDYIEAPVPGLTGTLRLWPHRIPGEGHFAAVLQRAGELSRDLDYGSGTIKSCDKAVEKETAKKKEKFSGKGTKRGTSWRGSDELEDFCRENLRLNTSLVTGDEMLQRLGEAVGMTVPLRIVFFGENVYLVSAQMPVLNGVRVLRPGLHLGELKKNRFEPSHALALALAPEWAVRVWNLDSRGRTILDYLSGKTFPAEGEKGWYLICVDGFSIGWGKLAGGIMKNHYPKGLRV